MKLRNQHIFFAQELAIVKAEIIDRQMIKKWLLNCIICLQIQDQNTLCYHAVQ